ncbi:M28 family peptidase [Bordetella genomosp. 8]|nr:M28 family peptidase [Bordetella genomosp. 8]
MNSWLDDAAADAALMEDFHAICAFGGRLSGTGEDTAAIGWALSRMRQTGGTAQRVQVPYDGWRAGGVSLALAGHDGPLTCRALLRSVSTPPGGVEGELIDLGQGRREDFDRAGDAVRGKVALVRHEYPFTTDHMHRRRKYDLAVERGALAFLIANPLPGGGVLSGSSGRPRGAPGIPAAYLDNATCQVLARAAAGAQPARVRLHVEGQEDEASMADLAILDIPGGTGSYIVISAHMDGHDLGTSALDNASGVAVALATARALAPCVSAHTHGLRVCLFTAEEWALAGSKRYLDDMDPAERRSMKLNINLDTVGGDSKLTALISEFPALDRFVADAGADAGVPVATYLPFMSNSDHANFAAHGIPAMRLVAGFDRPDSAVNNILSPGDTQAVVQESELRAALRVTCAMASRGLTLTHEALDALARR